MARGTSGEPTKEALKRAKARQKLLEKQARLKAEKKAVDKAVAKARTADNKVADRQRTRDHIVIGIAALKAATIDRQVRNAIDAAIYDLNDRDREHVLRDMSSWSKLPPLPDPADPANRGSVVPAHLHVEDKPVVGDENVSEHPRETGMLSTTSTEDPDMQVLPTADWRWYSRPDDANTDKPLRLGMSATSNLWLANTPAQIRCVHDIWEHLHQYDGLKNMDEIEGWIIKDLENDKREDALKAERLQEEERQREAAGQAERAASYVKAQRKRSARKPETDSS